MGATNSAATPNFLPPANVRCPLGLAARSLQRRAGSPHAHPDTRRADRDPSTDVLLATGPVPFPHCPCPAARTPLSGCIAATSEEEGRHDRGIPGAQFPPMGHTQPAPGALAASLYDATLIVKGPHRCHRCVRVFTLLERMCLTEHGVVEGPPACGHCTRQSHRDLPARYQRHRTHATLLHASG